MSLDILGSTVSKLDHLQSYRMESTEDLLAEKALLKSQRTIYITQNMGAKGMTRNLGLLEERLQAVNHVLRERGSLEPVKPTINIGVGVTDFNAIK